MEVSTRRAVLTITCPNCGGRVERVETTDRPQRIPCTYCRLDLHVPRVGERTVIREVAVPVVIREVASSEIHRASPGSVVAGVVLMIFAMLGLVGMAHCRSEEVLAEYDRDERAKERCESTCKTPCGLLPPPPDREPIGDIDINKMLRESSHLLCESDCVLKCSRM